MAGNQAGIKKMKRSDNRDESALAFKTFSCSDPLERSYLFYGEDRFVIEQLIAAALKKRFGEKTPDAMNYEVYRGGECNVRDVVESVRTVSMFGGEKLVVFRDLDRLSEDDLQRIVQYLEHPVRACLILTASKMDMRRKSWGMIFNHCRSYSCQPLTEQNVESYIREVAKNRRLTVTLDGIEALVRFIGPNRGMIERAFEKLGLIVEGEAQITAKMVESQVVDTRERSVFELTKAITGRNIVDAMAALRAILDQGQDAIAINGLLARHARMLYQVKLCQSLRMHESEIKEKLGLSYGALKDYMRATQLYSINELYRFHANVYEADRAMKSNPLGADLILSKLLLDLLP